jgi:hypothetical protein
MEGVGRGLTKTHTYKVADNPSLIPPAFPRTQTEKKEKRRAVVSCMLKPFLFELCAKGVNIPTKTYSHAFALLDILYVTKCFPKRQQASKPSRQKEVSWIGGKENR